MALTHPLEQYVRGSDKQSLGILPLYQSRWGTKASGDHFASLTCTRYITWIPAYEELDDLIHELELDSLRLEKMPESPYVQASPGFQDLPSINSPSSTTSIIQTDISPIASLCRSPKAAALEPCPSLESDHDGSSNGSNDGESFILQQSTPSGPLIPRRHPTIFTHIRQVLSSDPALAEGVISAIGRLPSRKRDLLIEHETTDNTEGTSGSSSNPSQTRDNPSKRRRTSYSNSGKRGRGEPRDVEEGIGGGHGGGGRENEGDQPSSSTSKTRNSNKKRRWICPFDLAYHEIRGIPQFSYCSPGNMTEKHLWKSHLRIHHSPEAKIGDRNAEPNRRFYMGQKALDAVLDAIDSHKGRPRGIVQWIRHSLELFVKVWYIIFPKDQFPHFTEPRSAFHPEDAATVSFKKHLADQARILVGAIHDAKADKAFDARTIASKADYRPTAADNDDVMSQAIAVTLLNSPGPTGTTHWLANASPDAIESAGREYVSQSAARSVTMPLDEEAEVERHEPTTQSNTVVDTPQLTPGAYVIPVPIFPNGTHFEALPFPNQVQSGIQMGYLTVPPGFFVIPTPPGPSMDLSMITQGLDNSIPFTQTTTTTISPQQVNWDPSIQPASQGVSLPAVQGRPTSQQEFGL